MKNTKESIQKLTARKRKELDYMINEYGVTDVKVITISRELDLLLNEFLYISNTDYDK